MSPLMNERKIEEEIEIAREREREKERGREVERKRERGYELKKERDKVGNQLYQPQSHPLSSQQESSSLCEWDGRGRRESSSLRYSQLLSPTPT